MANLIEVVIKATNDASKTFEGVRADSEATKAKLVADSEETGAAAKGAALTQEEAAAQASAAADLASASQTRLAAAQAEFSSASEAWAAAADGDTAAADRLVAANSRLAAAQAESSKATKAAAEAEAAAANVGNDTAEKTSFLSGRWGALAAASSAAGLIVGGVSVKMAGDFESSTTRLVTSAGESEGAIGSVRDGILAMTGQVGVGAEELSKGLYVIESAGMHGADGLTVLKAAAQGAKAENADLGTAADAVTTILADYHLKASDAATVMSQLVEGVSLGKTTLEAFAGSLHSVTPLAANLGIPLSDVAGALASMTMHGVSADQATQNLASTLRSLANPTAQQTNELAGLGVNAQKLSDDLSTKGLTGTLQEVSQAILDKMGPSGKVMLSALNTSQRAAQDAGIAFNTLAPKTQALAKEFMNGAGASKGYQEAVKGLSVDQATQLQQWQSLYTKTQGFNTILKNGGSDVQNYTQALAKAIGTSDGLNTALMLTGENTQTVADNVKAVAATTADAQGNVKGWSDIQGTFNQKLSEAKDGTEALAIRVGESLLPAVSSIMGAFAGAAKWISGLGAAGPVLATLVGGAVALGAAFAVVKTAMAAWTAITEVWSAVTKIATAVQWLFNVAMDANPIGLIIIAIVALVGGFIYLWTHVKGFRDFWEEVWHFIVDMFKDAWHWITNAFNDVLHFIERWGPLILAGVAPFIGIPLLIYQHWGEITAFFGHLWDEIVGFFARQVNNVIGILAGWVNWAEGLVGAFWNIVDRIVGAFESLNSRIANAIRAAINNAINSVNGAIGHINSVTGALGIPGIPSIPHLAAGGYGSGVTLVGENGPELLNLPPGSRVTPNGSVGGQLNMMAGAPSSGAMEVNFTGDTSSAFATAFMRMVREGKIVIRQSQIRPT